MNTYVIRRKNAWHSPEDLEAAASRSAQIGNGEMRDKVRWIRSYVVEEENGTLGTVCSRLFYAASTMICVPTALAQNSTTALGAQAGERRLTEIITSGGFSRVSRAAETPFNMVLEARP